MTVELGWFLEKDMERSEMIERLRAMAKDSIGDEIADALLADGETLKALVWENCKLRALIELMFASTLPYNDGQPTFSDTVTDMWKELAPL